MCMVAAGNAPLGNVVPCLLRPCVRRGEPITLQPLQEAAARRDQPFFLKGQVVCRLLSK